MKKEDIDKLADAIITKISGQMNPEARIAETGSAIINLLRTIAVNSTHIPDMAYTLRNLHKEVKAEFVDPPADTKPMASIVMDERIKIDPRDLDELVNSKNKKAKK